MANFAFGPRLDTGFCQGYHKEYPAGAGHDLLLDDICFPCSYMVGFYLQASQQDQ